MASKSEVITYITSSRSLVGLVVILNRMHSTYWEVLVRTGFESCWRSNFSGSAGGVSGNISLWLDCWEIKWTRHNLPSLGMQGRNLSATSWELIAYSSNCLISPGWLASIAEGDSVTQLSFTVLLRGHLHFFLLTTCAVIHHAQVPLVKKPLPTRLRSCWLSLKMSYFQVITTYHRYWWPDTLIITQAPTRAMIKVHGHQCRWVAGGYDLEIGHFEMWLAWWLPRG